MQPAFYYQEFEEDIRDGREWYYPTTSFSWKVRFSPPNPGEWQDKIKPTWELINEGDPASDQHYALADEFGKYMHCRVFRIPAEPENIQKYDYDHPNSHLITTSFWHSFPTKAFWTAENYPNNDYADLHAYNSTDKINNPTHEIDAVLLPP